VGRGRGWDVWKLGRIGGGKWERRRGNLDKMVFARW